MSVEKRLGSNDSGDGGIVLLAEVTAKHQR
jgi:hypothetical protein